ncbi:hypothetical protein TRFO_41065 [Tritrichomonas foetus]|uniref:Uncharacterized protein n=1 Tax=Tritrichomonas foetus TaxID=1144522 RepID=A0A1J4L1S8_9EUKA|nr:hypothetical protein TRFO_41065 [Tritrichomonas foetus]|eukprot:OHT17370.1 hypothetical protein TRFO_41065 [Tritrichomonas foetus]
MKKQLIKVGQEVDKNHKFYEEEILGDDRKIYPEKNNNNIQSNYELEEENNELKRKCKELEKECDETIKDYNELAEHFE